MGKKTICLIASIFLVGTLGSCTNLSSGESKKAASYNVDVKSTEEEATFLNIKDLQIEKRFLDTQKKVEVQLLAEKKLADDKLAEQKRQEALKAQEELRKKQEVERQAQLALTDNNARAKIFKYMSDSANQRSVMDKALKMNDGSTSNTCVYFASEVLRRVDIKIPSYTANCTQLTNTLKNRGWKMYLDYKSLEPGDLCFTTDAFGGRGPATHSYIFMGWVEKGKYDFAYIVDNQEHKYGSVYHIRNIAKVDSHGGDTKEAFRYYMRR